MPSDEVLNQPPPLEDYDPLSRDRALLEALRREGAEWAQEQAAEFGRRTASRQALAWGQQANENPPRLKTPQIANYQDIGDPKPGAHVARAAMMMLGAENEFGHGCPISMTYSAFPALQRQPDLLEQWAPHIVSLEYDPRCRPVAENPERSSAWG